MDPDETLKQIREACNDYRFADDLPSLFLNLDKWLSTGGFLPKAWERHRRATL